MRNIGVGLTMAEILRRIPVAKRHHDSCEFKREGKERRSSSARVGEGALVEGTILFPRVEPLPHEVESRLVHEGLQLLSLPPGFDPTENRNFLRIVLEQDLPPVCIHNPGLDQGGLWIFATEDYRDKMSRSIHEGGAVFVFEGLVECPPWPEGRLVTKINRDRWVSEFQVCERRGMIARLSVRLRSNDFHQIRRQFAAAGMPLLGDPLYGGRMVDGGIRLRLASIEVPSKGIDYENNCPALHWPEDELYPVSADDGPVFFRISNDTERALTRGHPWVLPDEYSDDADAFAPGTLVRLGQDPSRICAVGHIQGRGRVAARVWQLNSEAKANKNEVSSRVAACLSRRASLLKALDKANDTNVFRLIHCEADGFPGICVDYIAGILRFVIQSPSTRGFIESLQQALKEQMSAYLLDTRPLVHVLNLRPAPKGQLMGVFLAEGSFPDDLSNERGRILVHEDGLKYEVELGLAEPFSPAPGIGLFMDQRSNRRRLAKRVKPGSRWLNLFCHTGAFSVMLLARGAGAVDSVDLSAHYLAWLDDNLEANGLGTATHRSIRSDARRFVEKTLDQGTYDGIVVDPPTAAAAGRKYWSVKKGYREIVASVLPRLNSGGVLFLARNDRGARGSLSDLLHKETRKQKRRVLEIRDAGPGVDYPILNSFPEGDSFSGIIARVD